MITMRRQSLWPGFLSGLAVTALLVMSGLVVMDGRAQDAQPPTASDIADGLRLYEQKGN
jgi:hypothetical protein